MTDLPPIPDQARAAHAAAITDLYGGLPWTETDDQRVLEAAWPHLYAAALRHAADEWCRCKGFYTGPDDGRPFHCYNHEAAVELRRVADSVDPVVEVEGSVVDPAPTPE